jgi:diaminopimelate epimerase
MIPFVKMHGCGNDFVVVRSPDLEALDLGPEARADFVRRVCDRHFGIGADGLLAYAPGSAGELRMHYWNQDGSPAEMCGNGARCVVRLAWERGEATANVDLVTDAGHHEARVLPDAAGGAAVRLRMGSARWDGEAVGLRDLPELIDAPLDVGGKILRATALALGNPHAVVFVGHAELESLQLEPTGRLVAEHRVFRRGANASFVEVRAEELHVRVWERGAGATLACGTGACAALAAAWRLRRVPAPRARVHLPGGSVEVEQDTSGALWLTGPATRVAEGHFDPDLIRATR